MKTNNIKAILSERIDSTLVECLVSEYTELKIKHYHGDIENTILRAARFSECALAAVKYLSDSVIVDLNKLHFDSLYNELINCSKNTSEKEMTTLLIPLVLKSIYTIRNKKRIAHMKDFLPDKIDSEYVTEACNWTMAQLLILAKNLDVDSIKDLLNSVIVKQIPLIEEFGENEIMILKKDLTFKDELILVLYKYSERLSIDKLHILLKPGKKSYITTYLNVLYTNKLIQMNKEGAIITRLGIEYVEKKELIK